MDVTVDTSQIKVLQDFFNDLSEMNQRKIFISSYRKASKIFIDRVGPTTPSKSGDLRRSLVSQILSDVVSVEVGYNTNAPHLVSYKGKQTLTKTWYGHLLEVGSYRAGIRHWRKRKGSKEQPKAVGLLKPNTWFIDAYRATEDQMLDQVQNEWYDNVDSIMNKAIRKLK